MCQTNIQKRVTSTLTDQKFSKKQKKDILKKKLLSIIKLLTILELIRKNSINLSNQLT